ncbi:MAG: hypothetical protein RSK76_01455 [Clostridia bacterium]
MNTIELRQMSDLALATSMLQEKLDKLTNPNTPLAAKLRMSISHIKELDTNEKTQSKGWWYIQYYNETGSRLLPQEMEETELDRIGHLVQLGFGSGEIVEYQRQAFQSLDNTQ